MNSKINEVQATVEAIKNAPKAVVAFRATYAKNFPSSYVTHKSENPGNIFRILEKSICGFHKFYIILMIYYVCIVIK